MQPRYLAGSKSSFLITCLLAAGQPLVYAAENHTHIDDDQLFSLSLEQLLLIEVETRKTKENLAFVPVSNTVFSQQQMNDYNISSIYQLAEYVPNFSYRPSFGKLQERGVTRGIANITGDNVTGVFIDGMNVSGLINSLDISQFKYAEVVRGPQATLYGRSTFAGAINLVTDNPLQQRHSSASVSVGEQGRKQAKLRWGHQLPSGAALQINSRLWQKDGEYHNTLGDGGGVLNEQKHFSLSAITAFASDDNDLQGKITLIHNQDQDSPYATSLQSSAANNCYLDSPRQYYCGTLKAPNAIGFNNNALNNIDGKTGYQNTVNLINGHVTYRHTDQQTLTLNASWTHKQENYLVDGDYSNVVFYWVDSELEKQTGAIELQLTSQWSHKLSSLVALFYQNNETTNRSNAYYPPTQAPEKVSFRDELIELDNLAMFSSVSYQLTDNSDISADLRLATEDVSFDHQIQSGQQSFQTISPKISYRHTVDDKTALYASIANGTKPGGFNPAIWNELLDQADQQNRDKYRTFDQESLWQTELGIKGSSASNKFSYAVSVFAGQWDKVQTSQSVTFALSDGSEKSESIISNDGAAKTYGAEIELKRQHNSRLNSWASLGYAHTEFVDSETTSQQQLTGNASVSGNQIPNSPELTAAFGIHYQTTFKLWHLSYLTSFHHESERYVAEHNLAEIPAVNRMRLGVQAQWHAWSLALHSSIAEHSHYVESAARLGDPATLFRLRAFGLTLSDGNYSELTLKYQF